tara:strand:+ start:27490 stop:27723 length:234 start_codon:yes stop_codon:yes gene_type:complete
MGKSGNGGGYLVFHPFLDEWRNQFSEHRDKEPVKLTAKRRDALEQSEQRHREIAEEERRFAQNRKWVAQSLKVNDNE